MDPKLLSGTLEMLILEVISQGASYGYEISLKVLSRSDGMFELREGSLYPALHRLERKKFLASYWAEQEGRRRKYYKLTADGRKQLSERREEWQAFAGGINGVLGLEF